MSEEDRSVIIAAYLLPSLTGLDEPSAISTIEKPLEEFGEDHMEIPNWKPLRIINWWLEKKLITWNDEKQSVISQWPEQEYYRPSHRDISDFRRLTEYPVPEF